MGIASSMARAMQTPVLHDDPLVLEPHHSSDPWLLPEQGGQQHGDPGGKTPTPKRRERTLLARLRKPFKWITSLHHRGTYYICEDPETPGPGGDWSSVNDIRDAEPGLIPSAGQMTEIPEEEEASSTAGTPAATVPVSLSCFTFHRSLGAGGFGAVYLATDKKRKERVAIKVVNKLFHTEYGGSFVERNILRVSYLSPFLIKGLAAFHCPNNIFYVLELATRGDLYDFLRGNFPLDIPTAKFILAEVILGTQFLHGLQILHRDLKLQNLLLMNDGHVKISDFGLAVDWVSKTTTDPCNGTAGYAAPEMLQGLPHGRGVDYFSMGVILYQLLLFHSPFPCRTVEEYEESLREHTPLYPHFFTPDTVSVLQGLLCKDPLKRLGVKKNIRSHQFFADINWAEMEGRRIAPPAILTRADVDLEVERNLGCAESPSQHIEPEHQTMFDDFSFVCPEWSQDYHAEIKEVPKRKSWISRIFSRRSRRE